MFNHFHLCLPLFTRILPFTYVYTVYLCLLTYIYTCLLVFTYVYTCLSHVNVRLPQFTRAYLCSTAFSSLPMFTLFNLAC